MPELSTIIYKVWEIAASEAGNLKYPCIEREHILIGIGSIKKKLQSEEHPEKGAA
jgi:hypothetical protein